jgi:selenocysteine-specific elongation factor
VTVVVGTAGHIDHGKTALLRALTGIDADRLPEERRRGMTIDVGYAHMVLPGGAELDFVDVPGHDRLVGNMLVGAGEIDAAMLVVAMDDGPKAQTIEHLGLLDALGIDDGIAVLTKLDLLEKDDRRRSSCQDEVRAMLAKTCLAGIPMVAVSALSGEGIDALLGDLVDLEERIRQRAKARGGARLAIDRVFSARGFGVVVTGSLRGGSVSRGQTMRIEPDGGTARIREAQVHGSTVETTPDAGRVALNVTGVERDSLARGVMLAVGPAVVATTRLLVELRPSAGSRPLVDGATVRVHLATAETLARLRLAAGPDTGDRGDARLGALILAKPIAAALDDRFVLRWPSPAGTAGGGRVLDPAPPARLVRRRLDHQRLAGLADTRDPGERFGALVAAHQVLSRERAEAAAAILGEAADALAVTAGVVALGGRFVDASIVAAAEAAAVAAAADAQAADPLAPGIPLVVARAAAMATLQRSAPGASLSADDGAAIVAGIVERGALVRAGDLVRAPGHAPTRPASLQAAMDRLVAALDVATPPSLADATRSAGCPLDGVRALEAEGRIVRLEPDLAYATASFEALAAQAVALASRGALSPAALRDASGTSRRYALAILEELDGRGVLRRTPDGHVIGPRAARD